MRSCFTYLLPIVVLASSLNSVIAAPINTPAPLSIEISKSPIFVVDGVVDHEALRSHVDDIKAFVLHSCLCSPDPIKSSYIDLVLPLYLSLVNTESQQGHLKRTRASYQRALISQLCQRLSSGRTGLHLEAVPLLCPSQISGPMELGLDQSQSVLHR